MRGIYLIALAFVAASCAGLQRDCSASCASALGTDWIIVQQTVTDGRPYNCWQLRGAAIDNEAHSDGVFWLSQSGHLVHIAGQYNRVQVTGGDFAGAAKLLGVDLSRCPGGAYLPAVAP